MEKDKILSYDKRLLSLAKQLRKKSTLSEVILWNHIKGGKVMGYTFMRQKPIDHYIVDFFCKKLMLVVEVDGCTHDYKVEKDKKRQRRLESFG
jgi:very-short-patch-repair endonuclease